MARPKANNVDYFPTWKPRKSFSYLKDILDPDVFVDYIRNSSYAFIKKPAVRGFIFSRDNNKCVICGSQKNLHVDHVKRIAHVTINNYTEYNKKDSLQTLCVSCNGRKVS
ncbi:MAG: HNH endonuclease [Bacteroidales bacterium]|jgi:hypothetical protein|nr:HNH endonuclease [Candidatus Omnitrophota bacterium]